MRFGGLSEKEVEKITNILREYNIAYEIITDELIMNSNEKSMQYNLRHLNSPSISTHVLAIEINAESFDNMDEKLKKDLLGFGITNEVPEELECSKEINSIQDELDKGNKRLVGHGMLHQIMASVIFLLVYLIWLHFREN